MFVLVIFLNCGYFSVTNQKPGDFSSKLFLEWITVIQTELFTGWIVYIVKIVAKA